MFFVFLMKTSVYGKLRSHSMYGWDAAHGATWAHGRGGVVNKSEWRVEPANLKLSVGILENKDHKNPKTPSVNALQIHQQL